MYEAFFQLQRRPFAATPDASCCFAPESFQESLDELILRAENGQGIGILTAVAGTGKTLLCRRLIAELQASFSTAFLASANFPTRRALLQAILYELGQRYSGLDEQELRLELLSGLRNLAAAGKPALLVIDEAHLMSDRLLEEVRAISNLAEAGQPLIRVILCGQLALEERLTNPQQEDVNQHIACHVYLEPLTRQQSIEYIQFRLNWAGADDPRIFTHQALDLIAHACNGLPRCLNQLCDHSLLLSFVAESRQVTRQAVEDALTDLKQLPLHWNQPVSAGITTERSAYETVEEETIPTAFEEQKDATARGASTGDTTESAEQGAHDAVCFEIGADDGEESQFDEIETDHHAEAPESIDEQHANTPIAASHREPSLTAGFVPLAEGPLAEESRPSMCLFEEEPVADRYAEIDAGSKPRTGRSTTAETPAAGLKISRFDAESIKHEARTTFGDETHEPVQPVSTIRGEEQILRTPRPDQLIDEIIPLLNEACGDEVSESQYNENYNEKPVSRPQFTEEEPGFENRLLEEIAEGIGCDVFDVCADVGQSILERLDTSDPNLLDNFFIPHDDVETLTEVSEVPQPQYDVIEPEPDLAESHARHDDRGHAHSAAASSHVPRPNYKNVFSTLRRKLTQGHGRDA